MEGHEVYDFKNPCKGDHGFHWSEIDPDWQQWTPKAFRSALLHPIAAAGFKSDFDAMKWADAGVLVLPCGRSAHLEVGYFIGAGKPLLILLAPGEPELMYNMANRHCLSIDELCDNANRVEKFFVAAAQRQE
jgi:nucleoside 2-deoxyribosyltransferase